MIDKPNKGPVEFKPHEIHWAKKNKEKAKLTGVTAEHMLQHNYKVRTAKLVAEALNNKRFYDDVLEANREGMKAFDAFIEGHLRALHEQVGVPVEEFSLTYGPIFEDGSQYVLIEAGTQPIVRIHRALVTRWENDVQLISWDFSSEYYEGGTWIPVQW